MKVIGVIPARYSSSRLLGKPLLLIKDKTMIQRVYEQSIKSKLLNRVIVATDDNRIYNTVKIFGGEVVMTSSKHTSGTDRICEVIQKVNCNIVVNIQGDEPFIDPKNIDIAIKPLMNDNKLNVSTLAIKISNLDDLINKNKVKVVKDNNNFALYFSRNCIPYNMNKSGEESDMANNKKYFKHIGLYVYRKNFLLKFAKMRKSYLEKMEGLEQLRILENGEKIKLVITNKDSISIDTPEDLDLVNQLIG